MRLLNPAFSLLLLFLLVCSCGDSNTDNVAMEDDPEAEQPTNEAVLDAPGFDIVDRTDGITLVEMPATESFPNAVINGITYSNGKFDYDVSGYEFGVQTPDADQLMCANSDQGQHIHLIIDNEPYLAKYEPSFEQDITDGEHYMLTFLSRSYHQSIKRDRAARVAKVMANGGAFTSMEDIQEPMLFYSRPKGTYRGKKATDNVMIDFYPVNAPFEDGYTVMAELDGQPLAKFSNWKSYYIQGMEMGEHKLTLTLMDKDGNEVDTPLNPVTRTFTLEDLPTGE